MIRHPEFSSGSYTASSSLTFALMQKLEKYWHVFSRFFLIKSDKNQELTRQFVLIVVVSTTESQAHSLTPSPKKGLRYVVRSPWFRLLFASVLNETASSEFINIAANTCSLLIPFFNFPYAPPLDPPCSSPLIPLLAGERGDVHRTMSFWVRPERQRGSALGVERSEVALKDFLRSRASSTV